MIRRIRRTELVELAEQWHLSLEGEELDALCALTEWLALSFDELDQHASMATDVMPATREPGRPPAVEEDPYNAVVRWCNVVAKGRGGSLDGVRIGVKDSIAIAGIPMTAGSRILQTFIPMRDSVVAERILDAGGSIVAITNMDYFAFSGGGDTSAHGYTRNPFDARRTAGGSSSGSAAALYYHDLDVTLGCDQGGSIRIPAAWCGVLGLKPTHGLVPYTGIAGIDASFDHCGPLARSVVDIARILEVIAGEHESDPRQKGGVPVQPYGTIVAQAPDRLDGISIGIVKEGFSDAVGIEEDVADAVREVVEQLRQMGARVHEISLQEHLSGGVVAVGSMIEGMAALLTSGGNGYWHGGDYWPELAVALRQGIGAFGDDFSPQMKLTLLFGSYLQRRYYGYYYARTQHRRAKLREGYDRALSACDLLLMPTTPGKPHEHAPEMSIIDHVQRGWAVTANTVPTDATGHPALTIPAAEVLGLPVGVMLVGRPFDEGALLRAARTYELTRGWTPTHPGDPRTKS